MKNEFYLKREMLKTLKSMVTMYEDLEEYGASYPHVDDVLESLNDSIFVLCCSVCRKDILSFQDMVEWIKEQ